MAELALGAVHSLLGAIREEAQLLGRVQGDLQFIKEEMESMNSFLLHLAKTAPPSGEDDKQVRTWMKQVRDLANECSSCIDLYLQHRVDPEMRRARGLQGYLWWLRSFARSLLAQHQAAARLRELKVRAREVGKRRQRYGVQIPKGKDPEPAAGEGDEALLLSSGIRRVLEFPAERPPILEECTGKLVKWLTDESGPDFNKWPRAMAILAPDKDDGCDVALEVWHSSSYSFLFECQAWITIGRFEVPSSWEILDGLLQQLLPDKEEELRHNLNEMLTADNVEEELIRDNSEEMLTADNVKEHLRGKRALIVLNGLDYPHVWWEINRAISKFSFAAGSGVILITQYSEAAKEFCRPREPITYSLVDFFYRRALVVLTRNYYSYDVSMNLVTTLPDFLRDIQEKCEPHAFCMKVFVHALYANPNRTKEELERLRKQILVPAEGSPKTNAKKMLMFCYNDLPRTYKTCLLYLAIFPHGYKIRRSRLVERWVVEGFITGLDRPRTVRGAERCFDALIDRGFVSPGNIGAAGKVKSCMVSDLVHDFISEIAREENFVDTRLSHHLAKHFSIHSGLRLRRSDSIQGFLLSPPASSQLYQIKVLDLEGLKDLDTKHQQRYLKNIFKMLLLRYLSLRNTDITQLPKEIENLQQLEVLDIRQTKVPASAMKDILLPKLKRLLAGQLDDKGASSYESFFTVRMPRRIDRMSDIEVLSHVEASEADAAELTYLGKLWQLRKLGVVIHDKKHNLENLLHAISDLNECLKSLSIRVKSLPGRESSTFTDISSIIGRLKNTPKFLESLTTSGTTCGLLLPYLVKDVQQLAKVTLHNTLLKQDDLKVLADITSLHCLKLRHKSYAKAELTFKSGEFQDLKFLVVECFEITDIIFEDEAAPKLEKIVWSFTKMESLSGIDNLPRLMELEFDGDTVPNLVKKAIEKHPNNPVFKHNKPQGQVQETEGAATAP